MFGLLGGGNKKGPKGGKGAAPPGEDESGLSLLLTVLALLTGGVLLVIYNTKKTECKMYGIDATHWFDVDTLGNIPKWMNYNGIILVTSGFIGLLAGGPLSEALRDMNCIWFCCCCNCIAHVLHAVMSGMFGTLLLVICFFLACISNFIGTVWVFLGGLVRDPNKPKEYSRNYCDATIFYTAKVVCYSFWVFAFFVIFTRTAKTITAIVVGDERNYTVLILGDLSAGKTKILGLGAEPDQPSKDKKEK